MAVVVLRDKRGRTKGHGRCQVLQARRQRSGAAGRQRQQKCAAKRKQAVRAGGVESKNCAYAEKGSGSKKAAVHRSSRQQQARNGSAQYAKTGSGNAVCAAYAQRSETSLSYVGNERRTGRKGRNGTTGTPNVCPHTNTRTLCKRGKRVNKKTPCATKMRARCAQQRRGMLVVAAQKWRYEGMLNATALR